MGNVQNNVVATSIIQACRDGNLDYLQETLENNPKQFWKESVKTGLRLASKRGDLHIVKELLKRKIKANKKDMFGWGAIEYACMGGYVEIVDLLTEPSDWKGSRTLLNDTPLHIACRFKKVDVVQLLLEKKAKVNAKNSNLDTPLIIASARGSFEIVQLLLDKDAKVDCTNMQGKRAITVAKDKNIIALLMKAAGLTVGAPSTSSDESKDDKDVDEDVPETHPDFGTLLASYARYKTMKVKAVKCILSGPPKVGKTIFLNRILGRMENIQSSPHTPQSTGFEKPLTIPIYKSPEIVPTTITPEWIERTMEEEATHLLKYLQASFDEEDGYVESTTTDNCPSFPERSALDKSSDRIPELDSVNVPSTQRLDFITSPVERFFEDLLELDNPELGDVLENITTVYLMDTGGQPEFHEILPVILHGPSLHLLFFNLSHNLEDEVEIDYREEKGKKTQITYKSNYNTLQMLYQLLSSLYSISKESCNLKDTGLSAAVLLATHVDLLKEESKKQDITKKNDDLTKVFKQSDWYDDFLTFSNDATNVIFHPVDNMHGTQEEMAKIRTFLTDLIDSRFTSRELPCIWVAFHMILRRRYEKPTGVCTIHQCTELAIECGIEEIHVPEVLEYFHHNLGTVLYYKDVPKLNEIVICDPNILFQSITYLITASFGGEKLHHDSAEKVRKTGEIPTLLINFAISQSKDSPLTVEHLLNLLTHYNVITKMSYGENETVKYFMPCLLLPDPQFNITTVTPDQLKSQPLLIKFEGGYIPVGVFSALIVRLSHIWRLDESNRFRNHVHFLDIDRGAKIELLCRLSYLEIHVEEGSLHLPVIRETVLESLQIVLQSCNHTKHIKHITGFYCPGSSPDNSHFTECTSSLGAMLCSQRCRDYKNSVTPGPSIVKWFKEVLANQDSTSSLQRSLPLPLPKLTNPRILFVWLSWKIGVEWKWVGRDLGIDDNELDMIEKENQSQVREQAYRMLLSWERQTENPTYELLWGSLERTTRIEQSDFVAKANESEMSRADIELSTGYQEHGENEDKTKLV